MKAKQLDQQANEFQRKLENNGFISRERAEAARQEILDKNQRLQMLTAGNDGKNAQRARGLE